MWEQGFRCIRDEPLAEGAEKGFLSLTGCDLLEELFKQFPKGFSFTALLIVWYQGHPDLLPFLPQVSRKQPKVANLGFTIKVYVLEIVKVGEHR